MISRIYLTMVLITSALTLKLIQPHQSETKDTQIKTQFILQVHST